MKKQYIQPSMKAYKVKITAILAGSDGTQSMPSAGSNKNGGPTVAESKSDNFIDYCWE